MWSLLYLKGIDAVASSTSKAEQRSNSRLDALDRSRRLSKQEKMLRIHLAAVFTSKVMSACAKYDITPWSRNTQGLDIGSLMTEAEVELGIAVGDTETQVLGEHHHDEMAEIAKQRRNFAYSSFLRLTSDNRSR